MRVDVAVIGAGVAGGYAALSLSRAGLRVVLVERSSLPRHKVCGCCLNREAVSLLDEAGLTAGLMRAGAKPIERVLVCSGGRAVGLRTAGGLAVSRYVLDELLVSAARDAGCVVMDRTSAKVDRLAGEDGSPAVVSCRGGGEATAIEAGVVLVADGLAGTSLSSIDSSRRAVRDDSLRGYGARLPAEAHVLPAGEIVMRSGAGGYVGSVVLEDGSLDLAAAMSPAFVKQCGGIGSAAAAVWRTSGDELCTRDQTVRELAWRATAALTGGRERLAWPGVLVIGDAAGYVEPFTGEGMAWALGSAKAVLPIARRAASGWDASLSPAWHWAYRSAVARRRWRCRAFAAVLRQPRVTSAAVAIGSWLPGVCVQCVTPLILPPMFARPRGSDAAASGSMSLSEAGAS